MKIKDMRNDNFCEFRDVYKGECFTYNHNIYMKVNPSSYDQSNAVLLETGELCLFDSVDTVTPIEAELTIN